MKNTKESSQLIRIGYLFIISFLFLPLTEMKSQYLSGSLTGKPEIEMELSTPTAHYHPVFGQGDNNSAIIKGLTRYGCLDIDSSGKSSLAKFNNEEQVLFILSGTGDLYYNKIKEPVTKNDFIYIPAGARFGFSNPREKTLSVVVMGFKIPETTVLNPTKQLMIANADNVPLQILPSHGPTTQFQLLMGTTSSKRDRLASAYQVTSLFIMDFNADGTNIPHKHDNEEEIYLLIQGKGDIVAGESADGNKFRIPSKQGDAYFYSPGTIVGFYSGNKEGEQHSKILAVRYKF